MLMHITRFVTSKLNMCNVLKHKRKESSAAEPFSRNCAYKTFIKYSNVTLLCSQYIYNYSKLCVDSWLRWSHFAEMLPTSRQLLRILKSQQSSFPPYKCARHGRVLAQQPAEYPYKAILREKLNFMEDIWKGV